MGGLHFNPSDIQSDGVGLAAFLATVLALYIFLSARHEKLGRAMAIMLGATVVWSCFGFLYQIVPDIFLARELRVISVMGIVLINMSELNFALEYLRERVQPKFAYVLELFVYGVGAIFLGFLCSDLIGGDFVVGALRSPAAMVLAPDAGLLMGPLIGYYVVATVISGVLLAWRVRASQSPDERRQAMLLFGSMTLGLVLGGLRFSPWYGFDFYPFVADLGYPLFAFAALYSITRYRLLSLQVAAAQFLVFVLWTFTFCRILLDPSFSAALPDIGLFAVSIVLGVVLLRSAVAELRSHQELANFAVDRAKSEFVTIAAHQLRTPLAAARWTMDLLLGDANLPPEDKIIAGKGSKALENMTLIVNDLLDVARISNGVLKFDMAPGDLRAVVDTAVSLIEPEAERKHIALSSHVPEAPVSAVFDREKIAMAFENLVDNAIKYTPEYGSVELSLESSGGRAQLRVADTGIGVPSEERNHLFQRFYRGTNAKRMLPDGSGLGLYIVRTIVERHAGEVSLAPREGGGTMALIDLPQKLV